LNLIEKALKRLRQGRVTAAWELLRRARDERTVAVPPQRLASELCCSKCGGSMEHVCSWVCIERCPHCDRMR
jgi:hypothetical protein